MFGISGYSNMASTLTPSYLDALVTQALTYQRRSVELAQAQVDELNSKRSIYVELESKLNSLKSVAENLADSTTSVFGQKTVSSSDTGVVTATASSTAVVGTYNISISSLAKAHSVHSEQQLYIDQALGLSGTFVIGGAISRSVSSENTVANTVTDFDVGSSITSGQKELGTGTYYVEVRDNGGTWQFRLVDEDGQAISIATTTDPDSFTSNWQNLDDVAGTTYDTGRGLTISFGSGPYTAGMRGAGAASVYYEAQGAEITVNTDDTLADIASAINNSTFAEGNEVIATIVDRRLVLTAANMGTRHAIIASDKTGTVLSGTGSAGLGLLGDGGAGDVDLTDGFKYTLTQATDATLMVNGMTVTRHSNSGLTDVIGGLTINLLKEGSEATAKLTVNNDLSQVTNKINSLLSKINSLTSYLKDQTAVTPNADGQTYTRGGLAGDSTFYRLRFDLLSDLARPVPRDGESPLPAGDPTSLREIGITISNDLTVTISDQNALNEALTQNYEGVARLFDVLMDRITSRLEPFTRSVDSVMDQLIESLDEQIEDANDTVKSLNERMELQEASLRQQYAKLFQQIYLASSNQSMTGSLFGFLNLMG